jgi:dTDP-3-amino-2,3,6-trideoxy-4-keto-D-glucose/dTDP-3-amino-3,4,6-trideoxy-alpha-D-glucose/dTDP-2,6-dideoxy-D-kanosamine transaminase
LTRVLLNDPGRLNAALGPLLEAAAQRVLRSGRYVLGDEVLAFEQEFAAFCGSQHCVGVGNGTDALELALRALELGPGDEVATVANAGMYATAAILAVGARPVYIDIEPITMNMSATALAQGVSKTTKALVITHLYGQLAEMDEILPVARQANLSVIEDCAQAHGAAHQGRRAGSFGDISCFSFYPTKNLGALGDGGALLTDDKETAERLVAMRQYGWHQRFVSTPPMGRNSRLDELQAAMLRCKLPYLADWNSQRQAVIQRYRAALSGLNLQLPNVDGEHHAAHLCVVRTDMRNAVRIDAQSGTRDRLKEHLARQQIDTGIHYPLPDYRQPSVVAIMGEREPLPETEAAAAAVLSLPCFPQITDAEIDAVIAALQSAGSNGEL